MKSNEISIIIPNYNGESLLKENLPLVINAKKYFEDNGGKCEIIVVDDASEDKSVNILKNFRLKIVKHNSNKGYSASVHSGVKHSIYRLIFLLNSDVKIPRNILTELSKPFEEDNTFAVSPLITNIEGRISSGSYKIPFLKRGELKFRKWKHLNFENFSLLLTLFCEGGSVLIDKNKFWEIKGFDSIYSPFYYEDTDLCLKALKKGFKCYFNPKISVIHAHQSTIKKFYGNLYINSVKRRNRFILLWSNLPWGYLLTSHAANIIPRIFSYSLRGDFSYISGLLKAVFRLKEILKKRKEEMNQELDFFKIMELINEDFKKLKSL